MRSLALKGYRIIDFGSAMAGGMPGALLADMGAEVIKLESRTHIDGIRLGGINIKAFPDPEERRPGFHSLARGKLDITVDLTQPGAADLIKRLVKVSDVVFDNFVPGVLQRRGLDYDSLKKVNPKLVMVSASSAGQYGPLRDIVVYANAMTALSGLDSLTGYGDGRPQTVGVAYGDQCAAIFSVIAILMGLYYRNRTGKGQYIDLAAVEATACTLGEPYLEYIMTGKVPPPRANFNPRLAPYGNYPCQGDDQWVSIAVRTDEEWKRFRQVVGRPELNVDEKFGDAYLRVKNREELDRIIGEWTAKKTVPEAIEILRKASVAVAPRNSLADAYEDPHMKERHAFIVVDHPRYEGEVIGGTPWKLSKSPGKVWRHAPLVGQDNEYVFKEVVGLSDEEYTQLVEAKVIA